MDHRVDDGPFYTEYWKGNSACGWQDSWTHRTVWVKSYQHSEFKFDNSDFGKREYERFALAMLRVFEYGKKIGKLEVRKAMDI